MKLHDTFFGIDAVRHFDNNNKKVKAQMGSIDRLEVALLQRMLRDDVAKECDEKAKPPRHELFVEPGGARTTQGPQNSDCL